MILSKGKAATTRGVATRRAMIDPAAAFHSPQDVLRDSRLRVREKIEILSRWAYDSAELSVAEEEGMDGGESADMSEVLRALNEIATVDVQRSAPTKQAAFHVGPPRRPRRALPRAARLIPA